MAHVFITGSSTGLGLAAAQLLASEGHSVVIHGRDKTRTQQAHGQVPAAVGTVTGDLARTDGVRSVADQANELGPFDAVIHNAGLGFREPTRNTTTDGHARVLAVNVLAPYLLTAWMTPAKRLIYMSSGLNRSGDDSLRDIDWNSRPWNGYQAYNDSKLFDATLAFAMARLRPEALSNALEPGWVATRMGGAGAPDDLALAHVTQSWLAVSDEPQALVSGHYFFHQKLATAHPSASKHSFQDKLLDHLELLTGVRIPTVSATVSP